ncbi:histone kinase SNF1, putative [Babesia caballi]|uniref:Histone kinase SNF1, putative n=1 Tax=Babesia caballi TaxID=5871 RepID=A0AAV4LML3_BABCB|nr:histone kinase SNF1, putative [Babesia caballi]
MKMGSLSKLGREIRAMSGLRHPNVIYVHELIDTPTTVFIVMEYVEGGELFDYISQRSRLSEKEAIRMMRQVLSAVDFCHNKMICHRDIKPENILLDSNMNIKLGDFGLSNFMREGECLRTPCGSPNYASPEVICGKSYSGPEIDIWSCGIIFYVLLCGCLPFDDDEMSILFMKIKLGKFRTPSHLSADARHRHHEAARLQVAVPAGVQAVLPARPGAGEGSASHLFDAAVQNKAQVLHARRADPHWQPVAVSERWHPPHRDAQPEPPPFISMTLAPSTPLARKLPLVAFAFGQKLRRRRRPPRVGLRLLPRALLAVGVLDVEVDLGRVREPEGLRHAHQVQRVHVEDVLEAVREVRLQVRLVGLAGGPVEVEVLLDQLLQLHLHVCDFAELELVLAQRHLELLEVVQEPQLLRHQEHDGLALAVGATRRAAHTVDVVPRSTCKADASASHAPYLWYVPAPGGDVGAQQDSSLQGGYSQRHVTHLCSTEREVGPRPLILLLLAVYRLCRNVDVVEQRVVELDRVAAAEEDHDLLVQMALEERKQQHKPVFRLTHHVTLLQGRHGGHVLGARLPPLASRPRRLPGRTLGWSERV